MLEQLKDLYTHLEWADATMWKCLKKTDTAYHAEEIRVRVHHIHLVQRAFLNNWRGTPGKPGAGSEYNMEELFAWAKETHGLIREYLATLDPATLDSEFLVPWASMVEKQTGRPAGVTTRGETLYQCILHSTYHRGQVMTRLKEMGGEPRNTDYIIWLWMDRPEAAPLW